MKLINKFTLWFLAVTALVLVASGVIVFTTVQREIVEEEHRRMSDAVTFITKSLQKNPVVPPFDGYHVVVQERPYTSPTVPLRIADTAAWFPPHQHYERALIATSSFKTNGNHYFISISNLVVEPEEIERGLIQSLSWTFVLLLLLAALTSQLLSRRLLLPFNQTLRAIQSFSLTKPDRLQLTDTHTAEFKTLNQFLATMTAKATHDYQLLKEFTENASHEFQTPLAIIRGKMELLMESPISDEQARLILAAHEAVEKLSKINQALTLLTKLENQEYEARTPLNFSTLTRNTLNAFHELIEMKSIALEADIANGVHLRLNPVLADILLNNLLSNAIRHNQAHGHIRVNLTPSALRIRNTGHPPDVPTEQLFRRFKKSNQSAESIGLGLSIVRQICTLNHFSITYDYADRWHTLEVNFYPEGENVVRPD